MGENSGIQWTHHTFNPWEGCQRVSPGCQHCYAETRNRRFAGDDPSKVLWGPTAPRRRTSVQNWRKPLKWNKAAEAAGERHRVFCASLADVFEDRPELVPWRLELLDLIRRTPWLDWLLLTKRPENIRRLLEEAGMSQHGGDADLETVTTDRIDAWLAGEPPENVWLGTTVEDQQRANERIPHLLSVPAKVRFLSCEPLLERVDLQYPSAVFPDGPARCCSGFECGCYGQPIDPPLLYGINWVIIGGESGHGARPFALDWARDLVSQCRDAGAAPFVKQLGARVACEHCDTGTATCVGRYESQEGEAEMACDACCGHACEDGHCDQLTDPAGGDPAEWPGDLRVREFPVVTR